jgi:hypothetical protein
MIERSRMAFPALVRQNGSIEAAKEAGALDMTEMLEGSTNEAAKARFEDRELLQQFQEVERLPEEDKMVIKKLLDAFLTKKQLQALAR